MNLDTETRHGYTIPSSMKKVWAVQMELLKKLLEVCEKHQLKIWADGGTLLGTVREHGYIPWDDDIDMAMLRKDYDKLLEIAQKEFLPPYHFQSGHTDKNFTLGHAHLRKDNTAAIVDKCDVFEDYHQGIFIDIFVYDEIPDKEEDLTLFLQRIEKEKTLLKRYCDYHFSFIHPIISLKTYLSILPFKKIGFYHAFMNYDNLLKGEKGEYVACVGFSLNVKIFRRKKDLYEKTVLMPFEDIMMPVPIGYDTILKTQYGEYMKPVKSPSYHGQFVVLDSERSYQSYIPELRREVRKERRLAIYYKLRNFIMKVLPMGNH